MRKSFQPLLYALILSVGLGGGYVLSFFTARSTQADVAQQKILDVIRFAYDNYVDSVGYDMLVDDAIAGMLEQLDPHSVYIPKLELDGVNDQLNGSFEGIGIQFRIENDTIIVIDPIANGPSAIKGILPGDRIVKVDGKKVAGIGIKNNDVLKMLKGPKGTKVVLGISRKGVKGIHDYTITRDVIPLNSLDAAFMIDKNTGYIKLNSFSATTYDEFTTAMSSLLNSGMKNLILDLRDNGGGFLNAAVSIADDFIGRGSRIVYTKGRHRDEKVYYSSTGGLFEYGKLVVLIDEFSASASEILAGAIQDNDRGLIVGRRSFGKGLVQEQIELRDGSAFRLTVARYYTPSGRCIQKPYEEGTEEYYMDFYKSLLLNDSAAREYNLKKSDSLVYSTRKGRPVYGGGGIIPDSLVLHDFNFTPEFQTVFFASGRVFDRVFQFVDDQRSTLKKQYPSASLFIQHFTVPESLMTLLCADSKIKMSSLSEANKATALVFVKAHIARELFGIEAYYRTTIPNDNMVKAAMKYFL